MNKIKKVRRTIQIVLLCGLFTGEILWADVNSDLLQAVRNGDRFRVQHLISLGADLNTRDARHGLTPLHLAASTGNLEIAGTLILNGAEVNARDNYNAIPLHMATVKGKIEMTRMLLESGADYNAKDRRGATALYLAENKGYTEISQLFRRIINEGVLEPQFGYRVCHNYPYHLITGKKEKRMISRKDLYAAIGNNPNYDCLTLHSKIKLRDLSNDHLQDGDIIIFGNDHSGVVRQMGPKKMISHFRGYTDWTKKPPVRSKQDYGIYFSDLKQLSQFRTGNKTYGDRFVTICRRKNRIDPGKNISLGGKWRGVRNPRYIVTISGSIKSISYKGGDGRFEHMGSLRYDSLKQLYHGELKDNPSTCCGNDGEMWLKVKDVNTVMVKSRWWKKGTDRNKTVFSAGWESLKRQK